MYKVVATRSDGSIFYIIYCIKAFLIKTLNTQRKHNHTNRFQDAFFFNFYIFTLRNLRNKTYPYISLKSNNDNFVKTAALSLQHEMHKPLIYPQRNDEADHTMATCLPNHPNIDPNKLNWSMEMEPHLVEIS